MEATTDVCWKEDKLLYPLLNTATIDKLIGLIIMEEVTMGIIVYSKLQPNSRTIRYLTLSLLN